MVNIAVQCNRKIPLNKVLLYPCCFVMANRYVHNVLNIFLHILPAFVVDMFLKLSGRNPMRVFDFSSNNE